MQSDTNRQGRAPEPVDAALAEQVLGILDEDQKRAYANYQKLLDLGIAREISRIDLPLSLYTQWYWNMAMENARSDVEKRLKNRDNSEALSKLQDELGLKAPPSLIEGYDIAQLSGKYTVASLISFRDGNPDRSNYRRFNIRSLDGKIDDFESMLHIGTIFWWFVQSNKSVFCKDDRFFLLSGAFDGLSRQGIPQTIPECISVAKYPQAGSDGLKIIHTPIDMLSHRQTVFIQIACLPVKYFPPFSP